MVWCRGCRPGWDLPEPAELPKSPDGFPALDATNFTNDPLTARSTPVRSAHLTELRGAIATLRARARLGAVVWTDSVLVPGVTAVKRVHLTELRAALHDVYVAASRPPPTYTNATMTAGSSLITATHVAELRAAVMAIW